MDWGGRKRCSEIWGLWLKLAQAVCRRLAGSALLCIGRGLRRRADVCQSLVYDVICICVTHLESFPIQCQTVSQDALILPLYSSFVVL